MQWSDSAIILSAKKQGETSAILRVFSQNHGVAAGVLKGIHGKANRGMAQPGNTVNVSWQARLPEQLGIFKCELLHAAAAHLMQDAGKLAALTSSCALIEAALPERHPYPRLYQTFEAFIEVLQEDEDWPQAYVRLELELLADTGFGLDLHCCAATGTTEELIYVSPKSGRAVSRVAGEPYREKLLKLPRFLLPSPVGGRVEENSLSRSRGRDREGVLQHARTLRKNMTEAETQLWYHLRAHRFAGYGFRRQYPVENRYIVDFVCLDKKLVVELDGGQHAEQAVYDTQRTVFLEAEGYRVLRFWNNEVLGNMEGVLMVIAEALAGTPSLTLPPSGRGDILVPSPACGGGDNNGYAAEILAGMQLTGYFLEHWLLEPHRRKLPAARGRLIHMMKDRHGAKT